jgi:hypothetical protein
MPPAQLNKTTAQIDFAAAEIKQHSLPIEPPVTIHGADRSMA